MNGSRVAQLLEEHGEPLGPAGQLAGTWDLRIDHVVLGPSDGRVALAVLNGAAISELRPELTLVCADEHRPSLALPPGGRAASLLGQARRQGAHFVRPGCGGRDAVYRERYAAPGKLMVYSGPGASASGAFGVLAFEAGGLEAAEVMRSGRIRREITGLLRVRLHGSLAPWLSGTDVALELTRRFYPGGANGRIVEFDGAGVATLSLADRVALASSRAMLGAAAVVFPADDVTRAALEAFGRLDDWVRVEAVADDPDAQGGDFDLDLDTLEPRIAASHTPGMSRLVRQAGRFRVDRVSIGPEATYADLARIARVLSSGRVHAETELLIDVATVAVAETASRTGVLGTLRDHGARITRDWMLRGPQHPASLSGMELRFGGATRDVRAPANVWSASPETCAASALTGRLSDPREITLDFERHESPDRHVVDAHWVVEPPAREAVSTNGDRGFGVAPGVPLDRPLRGSVLMSLERRAVRSHQVLTGTPRAETAAQWDDLSRQAFREDDAGFTARARAHGGGFVVATPGLNGGSSGDLSVLVLRDLGVRVVFARGFDETFQRLLIQAGILPLQLATEREAASLEQGDELELPGLPEALEPGTPIVIRNLTRGTQITAQHVLDARAVAIVCAGGIVEFGSRHAESDGGA